MPRPNLSAMSIEALIDLRRQIDETLAKRRAEIETELKRMDGVVGGARGGSTLKGQTSLSCVAPVRRLRHVGSGRDVGSILIEEGLAVPFVCGATHCPRTPKPWCS